MVWKLKHNDKLMKNIETMRNDTREMKTTRNVKPLSNGVEIETNDKEVEPKAKPMNVEILYKCIENMMMLKHKLMNMMPKNNEPPNIEPKIEKDKLKCNRNTIVGENETKNKPNHMMLRNMKPKDIRPNEEKPNVNVNKMNMKHNDMEPKAKPKNLEPRNIEHK